jgi:hypothetical protein
MAMETAKNAAHSTGNMVVRTKQRFLFVHNTTISSFFEGKGGQMAFKAAEDAHVIENAKKIRNKARNFFFWGAEDTKFPMPKDSQQERKIHSPVS